MLARLMKAANNINIQNKLIITYLVVVAVPVMLVGLALTHSLREMALNGAIRQSSDSVENIKKRTAEILRVPIDISNQIFIDKKLRKLVNTRYESTFDVVKAYSEFTDFKDYVRLYKEISSIRMYTKNDTMLNNWEFFHETDEISESGWYRQALTAQGRMGWHYIDDETKGNRFELSLVRKIAYQNDKSYGMLVIGIDMNVIQSLLDLEPFETMIITDDGLVAASNNDILIGKSIEQLQYSLASNKPRSGTFEAVYDGKPSKVIIERYEPESSHNGIWIVSVFPIEAIVRDANQISKVSLLIMMASMLLAFVLILVFSNILGRRLRRLSKEIKKVASGNFRVSSSLDGEDEIGQVSRQFNRMVDSIRSLMDEVQTANEQKNQLIIKQKEIKLKMLASQINPHFLFNTLETIRMKAHNNGEGEIASAVLLLGKLMRKSLERSNEKVPLSEEIERVKCYLEIQKFRFGDRLTFHLNIESNVMRKLVFPFILQPIVENAVIHGLECKEGAGTVTVIGKETDGMLSIVVVDNGVGIQEDRLRQIAKRLSDPEDRDGNETESRIGLRNVHQRIQLSYGKEYGLSIESIKGTGTVVAITMPAEEDSRV